MKWVIAWVASVVAITGCGSSVPNIDELSKNDLDKESIVKSRDLEQTNQLWLLDWSGSDKAEWENDIEQGIIVAKYDGKKVTPLRRCTIKAAKYEYLKTSKKEDSFEISDKKALHAKVPLGVASLSGEIAAGKTLVISTAVVGEWSSGRNRINRGDLDQNIEECKDATHYVYSATVGAIEVTHKKKGKVGAKAKVMGAGGGAEVSKAKSVVKSSGDIASCDKLENTGKVGDECRNLVRIQLFDINPSGQKSVVPRMVRSRTKKPFKNGKYTITEMSARIQRKDPAGREWDEVYPKPDPILYLYTIENGQKEYILSTEIKHDTHDPEWTTAKVVTLSGKEKFYFELYDRDLIVDDTVAHCSMEQPLGERGAGDQEIVIKDCQSVLEFKMKLVEQ